MSEHPPCPHCGFKPRGPSQLELVLSAIQDSGLRTDKLEAAVRDLVEANRKALETKAHD